jgi:hypothetical protein
MSISFRVNATFHATKSLPAVGIIRAAINLTTFTPRPLTIYFLRIIALTISLPTMLGILLRRLEARANHGTSARQGSHLHL